MTPDYRHFINRNLPPVERGCTSKAVFISRPEALALQRHGRLRNGPGRMRPYHCQRCGWWHLGHRRRQRRG